jgi:hypothetical protein
VLSLVLCVATLFDICTRRGEFEWFGLDTWRVNGNVWEAKELSVTASHGIAMFSFDLFADEVSRRPPLTRHFDYGSEIDQTGSRSPFNGFLARAGFAVYSKQFTRGRLYLGLCGSKRILALPMWSLVVIFALAPLLSFLSWVQRRRRKEAGQCLTCGYDLTGNVSGVCPECGTTIEIRPPISN